MYITAENCLNSMSNTVMMAMTTSRMPAVAKAFHAMVPASSLVSWKGV